MRLFIVLPGLLALFCVGSGTAGAAEQTAMMSVNVVATGTDSTRSEGEWSKATFAYQAAFTVQLQSDGELSDINMYDPEYAEKAMAAANATMAKVQAALRGEFSDDEEAEAEPDNRYLLFMGQMQCPATLAIEVNERLEGEYADVGGMQPYTVTYTATSTGAQQERDMLCVAGTGILDIKNNTLYRSSLGFPEVSGHYVMQEANRGNLQDDPESIHNALPAIVSDHVFNTLRVAPAKGYVKTMLTPTSPVVTRIGSYGGYQGNIEVEITWDFEVDE